MHASLIVLIPYFGRWPAWIDLFVESCRWNPTVRWRLFTDCAPPANHADNVEIVPYSFESYKALARQRLGIEFDPPEPYKLCDLRPALGELHAPEIEPFDFWGFGDLDVIYGDLRRFYTDNLLATRDVLSTHPDRLSGHLAIFRNTARLRTAYRRYGRYRAILSDPAYVGLDESLAALFRPPSRSGWRRRLRWRVDHLSLGRPRALFEERYSTVLSRRGWHDGTMAYPRHWFWHRGRLTNDRDGDREFMYLHFMRWHSRRWISHPPAEGEGAWVELDRVVNFDWREAATDGFRIGRDGFTRRTG